MQFTVSKTYEIITPESAEIGDAAERGYEFENQIFTLHELIDEINNSGFTSLSESPIIYNALLKRDGKAHVWLNTTDPERNYRTGEETFYGLHIECTHRQLARILRAAGLI